MTITQTQCTGTLLHIYIYRSSVLTALFSCYMTKASWNCCRLDAPSACTIHPRTSLQCHFISSHIRRVHVCLAVTCHMHFWHNDRDCLRATAVARGRNRYRNKSQHRKLTLDKKNILKNIKKLISRRSLRLPGLEPATFRSLVRRSNHWATSTISQFIYRTRTAEIHPSPVVPTVEIRPQTGLMVVTVAPVVPDGSQAVCLAQWKNDNCRLLKAYYHSGSSHCLASGSLDKRHLEKCRAFRGTWKGTVIFIWQPTVKTPPALRP